MAKARSLKDLKEKDPVLYKALTEKRHKKVAERKDALKKILAFAAEKGDDTIKKLVAIARVKEGGEKAAPGKAAYLAVFEEMFKAAKQMHEDIVFKQFRVGRTEMRRFMIDAVKKPKPEDRIWVSFDFNTGLYNLKGKGATPPADWNGYRPLEEAPAAGTNVPLTPQK